MPLDSSLVRLSYLQQNDLPNDATQLLNWLDQAKTTIEENEQTISQLLVEKQSLINQLERLQQEINAKANSNLKFEKEGRDYFQLIKELELKDHKNQELNEINQVLEKKLNRLISLTSKQSQEREKNQQTIEELKGTIQEKEELITNLREKLSGLNKKQQQYRQSKQELEKQVNFLFSGQSQKQLQITKQQAQIDYLKDKNKELNQFQFQLINDIDLEKKKTEQLQKKLSKNNSTNREELLTSELEQVQEKLEQVENNLQEKEDIITELENKLKENEGIEIKEDEILQKLEKIKQEFQAELAEKEKLLIQTSQELNASNRLYSELLSKYQTEKGKSGIPWVKYGIIGLVGAVIVLLVIWLKRKFGG